MLQTNFGTIWNLAQPSGSAAPPGGAPTEGVAVQGAPASSGAQEMPPGACGSQSPTTFLLTMIAMFAVFYFLLIRPQQKKAKEHQGMLDKLQKGDEVVTAGGMIGKITGITDKVLTVEISEKVRVRVLKSQVVDKYQG